MTTPEPATVKRVTLALLDALAPDHRQNYDFATRPVDLPNGTGHLADMRAAILAIEAEAPALDVERLARALWNVLGWPEQTPFRETVAHEDGDNAHWNEMARAIAATYQQEGA